MTTKGNVNCLKAGGKISFPIFALCFPKCKTWNFRRNWLRWYRKQQFVFLTSKQADWETHWETNKSQNQDIPTFLLFAIPTKKKQSLCIIYFNDTACVFKRLHMIKIAYMHNCMQMIVHNFYFIWYSIGIVKFIGM